MVAEQSGGRPPSPASSLLEGASLDAAGPVGSAAARQPPPAASPPPLSSTPAASTAQVEPGHLADTAADYMPLDGEVLELGQPSCSQSPSPLQPTSLLDAPSPDSQQQQQQQQQRPAASFVPLSELGGSAGPPPPAFLGSSDEEPSTRPDDRPPSAGGYESGDDMDVLNMQHCTNCTGALWGHICMDCGHMPAHDDELFAPTVPPSAAARQQSLRGDALTVLAWDERMELHEEAGPSVHPERPDRVRAVVARLRAAALAARCKRLPAREATPAEVGACHVPELLEAVDLLSEQSRLQGGAQLRFSSDTYVNQHTALCAKLSAGACVDVATAVVRGEAAAGVAVVRPPGHHAESNTAMGFCFFNNAGIAARAAQAAGAERVLVLDWDVHHGNGTQHIFEDDPSVLYMSLHRHDGGSFYPGTGAAHEIGRGEGEGFTVNVPWPCGGMRNGDYLAAFAHVVLPIAYEYAPDLVIISAGFDAAEGDPIGGCHLTPECYAHMAAQLQLVAPTVALLEGGYNLLSTAAGTEAVLRVLLGERPPPLPPGEQSACEGGLAAVARAMRVQARHWACMRGLVQQQFRAMADAAARKQSAASAAAAAAAAAGEDRHDLHSGPYLLDEGEEWDDDGCGPHLPSRRPWAAAKGMEEEAEADTPSQQYPTNSGWESDADLASDEQQLSPAGSDSGQLERGAAEQGEMASPHSTPSLGSPLHPHGEPPLPRAASETLLHSDSGGSGSGTASDGSHGRPAGLTSASLSGGVVAGGQAVPALERSLDATPSPPADGALPPLQERQGAAEAAGQPGARSPLDGGGSMPRWKGLAPRAVVLKRPSQPGHQRLSPALLEDAALQLAGPRLGGQPAQPGEERAVPQQES